MSTAQHESDKIPIEDVADKTPASTIPKVEEHTSAEGTSYPAPLALFFLMSAICVSIFLVSLDRTIITTVG